VNEWSYTSTPPIRLHGVVLSYKKKSTGTTFTFTFTFRYFQVNNIQFSEYYVLLDYIFIYMVIKVMSMSVLKYLLSAFSVFLLLVLFKAQAICECRDGENDKRIPVTQLLRRCGL